MIDLVNTRVINTDAIDINPVEYYNSATQSIEMSYKFYHSSMATMEQVLAVRINQARFTRNIVVGIAILVVLFVSYLFVAFLISVTTVVSHFEKIALSVASGNLKDRMIITTNDELSNIGVAFNDMTQSLHTLVGELYHSIEYMSSASEELTATTHESLAAVQSIGSSVGTISEGNQEQQRTIAHGTSCVGYIHKSIQQNPA